MQPQTKLATCCYCGKRTALQLNARDGHELACGACGAPLHNMKALKVEGLEKPKKEKYAKPAKVKYKKEKKKKKKPLWSRALGEAFDVLDDIFD